MDARRLLRDKVKQYFGVRPLLLIVLVIGCLVRLPGLDRDLWFDEAHALFSARGADFRSRFTPNGPEFTNEIFQQDEGWGGLLRGVSHTEDTPPLYFMLLRLWIKLFGEGNRTLRLLSVIIGLATIPVMFFFGRAIFSQKVGLAAAFVLAILPVHIQYSQEIRPFALALLLTLLASWVYWKAHHATDRRREWRCWLLYIGLAALSLYTNYYTAGVFIAHGLFSLLQPHTSRLAMLKRHALVAALILLLMTPWLFSSYFLTQWVPWYGVIQRVESKPSQISLENPKTLARIAGLGQDLIAGWLVREGSTPLFGLVALYLVAVSAFVLIRAARVKETRRGIIYNLLVFFIPAFFVIATGLITKHFLPTHSPKYILPTLTGLCPLFGAALVLSRYRTASMICAILLASIFLHFNVWRYTLDNGAAHPAWHGRYGNISPLVAKINEQVGLNDLLIFAGGDIPYLLEVWNVYQRRPVPQIAIGRRQSGKNQPIDFESRWKELETKYSGIYYIHGRRLLPELVRRFESSYRLKSVDQLGRVEVRHYVKQVSAASPTQP